MIIGEAALGQQAGGEAALRQQLIHQAKLAGTGYPQLTIVASSRLKARPGAVAARAGRSGG